MPITVAAPGASMKTGFFEEHYDDVLKRGTGIPPVQFLKPEDYVEGSELFRYSMKGAPRSTAPGAQLREQIKTTLRDEPYLPGTALKGAFRTALAWHGWEMEQMRPQITQLNRRREFAAQSIEQSLFGSTPNRDLLRALQVGDSAPVSHTQLMVANVNVMGRGGKPGSPIEVEAVRPETRFKLSVKLDRALFSNWAQQNGLRLAHEDWLLQLTDITHNHARARIASELAWFEQAQNSAGPAGVCSRTQRRCFASQAQPVPGATELGTGWGRGKTLGSRLQDDPDFMDRLINDYRMAKGDRQPGDAFPKSRRLYMKAQPPDAPASPLGWAWLTFQKVEVL